MTPCPGRTSSSDCWSPAQHSHYHVHQALSSTCPLLDRQEQGSLYTCPLGIAATPPVGRSRGRSRRATPIRLSAIP